MKYQFSKQIRLSFVSFIKKHSNLGAKWCEKWQITPRKFWILSNRDSFKRWIYQVLILKGNTNSQTAILNVVISIKIQEKIQKKKKMIIKKLFHNKKNNKFYKDSIYNNIFYVNTTLVKINHKLSMKLFNWMPDLVVWQQRIYFQKKKLKTLKSRKLKQKHIRKSLYELFGFWKYSIP